MVLPSFIENVSAGPGFTQSAMDVFPGFGSYFVAIALFFSRIHNDVSLLLYC
jgi:hypothetical protein